LLHQGWQGHDWQLTWEEYQRANPGRVAAYSQLLGVPVGQAARSMRQYTVLAKPLLCPLGHRLLITERGLLPFSWLFWVRNNYTMLKYDAIVAWLVAESCCMFDFLVVHRGRRTGQPA
jgi:hypothetical protein